MNSIPINRTKLLVAITAICLSIPGCYPDGSKLSETAAIQGEVTLDSVPLNKAKVVFLPTQLHSASGKIMPIAYGQCDAKGVFKLAYSNGSKDLMAGEYNVLITTGDSGESGMGRAPFGDPTSQSMNLVNQMIARSPADPVAANDSDSLIEQVQVIPAIYNQKSELLFNVEASSEVVLAVFELTTIDPMLLKK